MAIPKAAAAATTSKSLCRRLRPRGNSGHRRRRTLSTTSNDGYQSFGSFHTQNVDDLMRLPNHRYNPPELPFDGSFSRDDANCIALSPCSTPFANSHRYMKSYSHLDRGRWTFLNHGAFGLALDVGLGRARSWRDFLESQPLRYFDRFLLTHLAHGARRMAAFVTRDVDGAAKVREGMAMIQNVTSGMNAVVGGHARCNDGNRLVFYFDIACGSTKKMCQRYHGNKNSVAIPFEKEFLPLLRNACKFPEGNGNDIHHASAEVFLKALDAAIHQYISQNGKSRLAGSLLILDHITSNTAIQVPIASIAKYAKEEYGMMVAVDGAHALLGLPLDMGSVLSSGDGGARGNIDIYLTNAHKWFSSPRGAALLFCAAPEIRDTILAQPAIVSHGVDDGFLSRFMWDGCRDYSAQLSLPAVLDYWDIADADVVREEMKRNLREGVRILISHWHPGVCSDNGDIADMSCIERHSSEAGLTLVPLEMHAPMMALVRLPDKISGASASASGRKTTTDAKRFQDFLYGRNVEVPIKCVGGVLYARVSCHVYNTADEFEHLAKAALHGVNKQIRDEE